MRLLLSILLLTVTLGGPALAHTGTGSGFAFLDGLRHPVFGLDHLLVMVGVGLWAGLTGGRAVWLWPLSFVSLMAVGGALAIAGIHVGHVETAILVSVVGIGAAIGLGLKPPVAVGAIACGLFALAHGHAHGTELPAGASAAGYVAGFLIATAGLHAAGVASGIFLSRSTLVARAAGAAIAATGALLAFS